MSIVLPHASHPGPIDDEIAALTLQLEEIDLFSQSSKGKHPADHPPDIDIAFASFQAEIQGYKTFLDDEKLAQSIAAAVHTDSPLIGDLTSQDVQAHEDRCFALELSNNDPEIEAPPPSVHSDLQHDVHDWMSAVSGNMAAASVIEFSDDETEAGPSMSYRERQADIMKKLSMEFQCCACTDRFPRSSMVTTTCSHRYCVDCIKILFMRSTHDEGLYPPRCCKNPIPLALVAKYMDPDELATFKLATVEYATPNRTYCSNHTCTKFIVPNSIESGTNRATCSKCGTETCAICNNAYHQGSDCPDDPSLRQTRELAREMGWQTCYACDRVVQLRSGCNHMTCPCKAEFCYVCGVRWKECNCNTADLNRIEERAEEIVDRDAGPNILPGERRRRVHQVFAELQDNHECEHSRIFERIFGGGRRGFRCEMCDARHRKYILQCRLCWLNVCEDCRRNRI
ncbi:hypothetical protein BDW02DRAFT_529935 [Decorospora gaudefroyi]|uniref:RBR-type E3 ubiquitin transferase n=1 Tax=Decorospora gaudefroyi TaxID=184978 RepID=A0A6A5K6J9_9PLEO|nr:hypothetical protein BDW02DRAFT_529935 [Decorospora gaudefroyi]